MSGGLTSEFGGHIRTCEQTGDADIAAEESIGDGDEPDLDAGTVAEFRHQRCQHTRSELAGDDTDWTSPISRPRVGDCGSRTTRRSVAVGGGAVDRREEARACPDGGDRDSCQRGRDFGGEGASHPDPVLVL